MSAGLAQSEGCDKVDPNAPIVKASATPTSGQAPLVVRFTSSATDPNGTAPLGRTAYLWEFGDGSSAFGANQTHRYTAPGTIDAVLTVTDPERKSTDKTIRIIVHPQGGWRRSSRSWWPSGAGTHRCRSGSRPRRRIRRSREPAPLPLGLRR